MSWIICPDEKNGLLDLYPGAAAAYSLRNLTGRSGASSPVVRVRRSSDNTEQDFTAAQITDGTLTAFCGAGDGFVRTWYDQSGNNYHAEQTLAAAQPKIVASGTLVTENSQVALAFDGSNDGFIVPNSKSSFKFLHDGTTNTSFAALKPATSGIAHTIFHTSYASAEIGVWFTIEDRNLGFGDNAWRVFATNGSVPVVSYFKDNSVTLNKLILAYAFINADASPAQNRAFGAIDGSTVFFGNLVTDAPNTSNATNDLRIGYGFYQGAASGYLSGTMQELIIYNTDQSTNRAAIEANINAHYSIF